MKILILLSALFLNQAFALDIRYCEGQPQRYADGTIKRSAKAIREFKLDHPCPVTGLSTGACPGWAADHIIPLACGGCDVGYNLAWMPLILKSGPGRLPKDRWERKVYCNQRENVTMPEQPLPLLIGPCPGAIYEGSHN